MQGAGQRARDFSRAERALQDQLIAELRQLSVTSAELLRGVAPEKTGHLKMGIRARISFQAAHPMVNVVSESRAAGGYNYTSVTRFGHRQAQITPRAGSRFHGFYSEGYETEIYPKRVRGYRPARDWVEAVMPQIKSELDRATRSLGRRFELEMRA